MKVKMADGEYIDLSEWECFGKCDLNIQSARFVAQDLGAMISLQHKSKAY